VSLFDDLEFMVLEADKHELHLGDAELASADPEFVGKSEDEVKAIKRK